MLTIAAGKVLTPAGWRTGDVWIRDGLIAAETVAGARFDAAGLLVLPGMIDIHGDAFERQVMPRPGVSFDLRIAFQDTDRQLAANGITTAYHGVTCSWEPGLRSGENARAIIHALKDLAGRTATDMRVHLRHETFNLDAVPETLDWIGAGLVHALAFNDHMRGIVLGKPIRASKVRGMIERSGLAENDFMALVERTLARGPEIPASLRRLAEAARRHGAPLLSHDDRDLADRRLYRDLGCSIAEFPITEIVAQDAITSGEHTVFGAPNVVRGGSHTGWLAAADMAQGGLCTILSTDYYYPALLEAPFRLAREGRMRLENAWALVSAHPAEALRLADRGAVSEGRRADLVIVDASGDFPRLVATLVKGEPVWLAEPRRLRA